MVSMASVACISGGCEAAVVKGYVRHLEATELTAYSMLCYGGVGEGCGCGEWAKSTRVRYGTVNTALTSNGYGRECMGMYGVCMEYAVHLPSATRHGI